MTSPTLNQVAFQHDMKSVRKTGHALTPEDIATVNIKSKKYTDEFILAYNQSGSDEEFLKAYIHRLKEMMFITHHKMRQPVANIVGMANLMDYVNSPEDLKTIVEYMKRSAHDLDVFIADLTVFMANLGQVAKKCGD